MIILPDRRIILPRQRSICDSVAHNLMECSGGSTPAIPASMKALLHMDTSAFADVKGHTVSQFGTVALDTSGQKFGAGCATFDGSSNALKIAASADFASDAWTFQGWVKTAGNTNKSIIAANDTTSPFSNFLNIADQSSFISVASSAATVNSTSALPVNTWAHLLVCHSGAGTPIRIFINGTLDKKSANVSPNMGSSCYIVLGGRSTNNGSTYTTLWAGGIDEFRYDNVDLHPSDANFTVESSAWPW